MNPILPTGGERPPIKAITSWRFDVLFFCAIPFLIVMPFLFIGDLFQIEVVAGLVFAALILAMVVYTLPKFWYKHYYYMLSNDEVLIQKGAFTIQRTIVPFARIQNIDTYHGPLDRKLGLINIKIHTAASPITIKCVSIETGERIREEMMERVKDVKDGLLS